MKSVVRGFFFLVITLAAAAVSAQMKQPWCGQDVLAPAAQPYPAPNWTQLEKEGVPDYQKLSENFRITQSLRLLVSTMEKTIVAIEDGKSLAGVGDINGFCLCDCNQDVAYWTNFLGSTVKSQAQSALNEAQDQYIKRIQAKIDVAQQTVYDTIPNFKSDVEKIVSSTCAAMNTCDPKSGIKEKIYKDAGELAQKQLETLLLSALAANGFDDVKKEADALQKDTLALLSKIAGGNWKAELSSAENRAAFQSLKDRLKALIDKAIAVVKNTVVTLANDWQASIQKITDAVLADLAKKLDADAKLWETLGPKIKQAVDARVQAIKTSVTDVYDTAIDRDKVLDDFRKRLESGLLQSFSRIEGCYGVTKRGECTAAAFCKGRPVGKKLFNNDDLQLPLWAPTDAFKDPDTAVRWALSALDWLEKVKKVLKSEQTSAATDRLKELIKQLKNGQEILDQLNRYIDLYTEGYHQGAYSHIRTDLTSCVAWAGSGPLAEVFNVSGGDFRGGANYLSANLTNKHDIQFRSGGMALFINGRYLSLAPGVSLVANIDGWKLFDRNYPFGIGRGNTTSGWSFDPANADVFNLVKKEDLQKYCCAAGQTNDCIPCPITGSSFLHKGFYPVQYKTSDGTLRVWPRTNTPWEFDERIAAVAGAGLNHDFKMKTRYWSAAPIPVMGFATITPWMSLDAGVGWHFEANRFRDVLRDQINKNLPAQSQLTKADFARDSEPFQAPDATLDAGNSAEVKPKLGADVVLGFNIAKFLRVGITASLFLGVDVSVEGRGGILDLDRGLVDSLKDSNPAPKKCEPKIVDNGTRVCSNETFKRKAKCADVPEADRKDCVDLTPTAEVSGLFSTGTYKCQESGCEGQKGYCKEGAKIIAHDVTREQCETTATAPVPGRCIAPYRDRPSEQGGATEVEASLAKFGPPNAIAPWEGYRDQQVALAQEVASKWTTKEQCEAFGWCFNYKYVPQEGHADYRGAYLGYAHTRETCPTAHYREVPSLIIYRADGVTPVPAQFIKFEWATVVSSGNSNRVFYPYQCVNKPRPEVTAWEGPDCNPIAFGYPSACPGANCSCTPGGPPCPAGQVCVDGACVPKCTSDASCGQDRKCVNGGCVLANGVPYAEQVAFRMRSANAPQHTVATYGLDKLITSVVAGIGVNVGIRYKLFRNWKEKNVLDQKWNFTLASFPGVKHQLGLEAQYQNDCDAKGTVTNHQADLVKRNPGGVSSTDLVKWCKPAMAADAQNPVEMPSVDETIGASIDDTLKFGADIGMDFWTHNQLCAGGKTWDQYFASLESDPAALWKKLRCSYTVNGVARTLDCASGAALQASLVSTLGCLDAALPSNKALLQLLPNSSSWLVASTNNLDLRKLFVDAEGEFERANLMPAVAALNAATVDAWLAALNTCLSDAPAGRFVDANLQIVLDLKKEDFQPCGVAPATSQPPKGACMVFGKCQEVVSASDCEGSYFYAGKSCSQLTPDEQGGCVPLILNETATWTFDETKSPSHDLALADNVATLSGATSTTPGINGNALCFDGRTAYTTVADHPEIDFSGACPNAEPFTIAFWIRTTRNSGVVPILDKRQKAPVFIRGYHVFLYNGRPGLQIATGPGSDGCSNANTAACTNEAAPVSIADGAWHFLAIRIAPRCGPDATGAFFVDGQLVSTFKPRQGELANDAPLNIGRLDPAFGASSFEGCIDDLTIIKAGLSASEIRALYYSAPRGKCRPKPCTLDSGMTAASNTFGRRAVLAQTFTPSKTGYLTSVTHGLQSGAGTVTAYDLLVTTTTSSGVPSWSGGSYSVPAVLYSATDLTTFSTNALVNGAVPIPADRRLLLQEGVRYALILIPKGPPTGTMNWRGNSGASSYPAGSAYELVGATWTVPSIGPRDHGFVIGGACQ